MAELTLAGFGNSKAIFVIFLSIGVKGTSLTILFAIYESKGLFSPGPLLYSYGSQ